MAYILADSVKTSGSSIKELGVCFNHKRTLKKQRGIWKVKFREILRKACLRLEMCFINKYKNLCRT